MPPQESACNVGKARPKPASQKPCCQNVASGMQHIAKLADEKTKHTYAKTKPGSDRISNGHKIASSAKIDLNQSRSPAFASARAKGVPGIPSPAPKLPSSKSSTSAKLHPATLVPESSKAAKAEKADASVQCGTVRAARPSLNPATQRSASLVTGQDKVKPVMECPDSILHGTSKSVPAALRPSTIPGPKNSNRITQELLFQKNCATSSRSSAPRRSSLPTALQTAHPPLGSKIFQPGRTKSDPAVPRLEDLIDVAATKKKPKKTVRFEDEEAPPQLALLSIGGTSAPLAPNVQDLIEGIVPVIMQPLRYLPYDQIVRGQISASQHNRTGSETEAESGLAEFRHIRCLISKCETNNTALPSWSHRWSSSEAPHGRTSQPKLTISALAAQLQEKSSSSKPVIASKSANKPKASSDFDPVFFRHKLEDNPPASQESPSYSTVVTEMKEKALRESMFYNERNGTWHKIPALSSHNGLTRNLADGADHGQSIAAKRRSVEAWSKPRDSFAEAMQKLDEVSRRLDLSLDTSEGHLQPHLVRRKPLPDTVPADTFPPRYDSLPTRLRTNNDATNGLSEIDSVSPIIDQDIPAPIELSAESVSMRCELKADEVTPPVELPGDAVPTTVFELHGTSTQKTMSPPSYHSTHNVYLSKGRDISESEQYQVAADGRPNCERTLAASVFDRRILEIQRNEALMPSYDFLRWLLEKYHPGRLFGYGCPSVPMSEGDGQNDMVMSILRSYLNVYEKGRKSFGHLSGPIPCICDSLRKKILRLEQREHILNIRSSFGSMETKDFVEWLYDRYGKSALAMLPRVSCSDPDERALQNAIAYFSYIERAVTDVQEKVVPAYIVKHLQARLMLGGVGDLSKDNKIHRMESLDKRQGGPLKRLRKYVSRRSGPKTIGVPCKIC